MTQFQGMFCFSKFPVLLVHVWSTRTDFKVYPLQRPFTKLLGVENAHLKAGYTDTGSRRTLYNNNNKCPYMCRWHVSQLLGCTRSFADIMGSIVWALKSMESQREGEKIPSLKRCWVALYWQHRENMMSLHLSTPCRLIIHPSDNRFRCSALKKKWCTGMAAIVLSYLVLLKKHLLSLQKMSCFPP